LLLTKPGVIITSQNYNSAKWAGPSEQATGQMPARFNQSTPNHFYEQVEILPEWAI